MVAQPAPIASAVVTVTGSPYAGGLVVSQPMAGQVYVRGQDMPITWSYPVTPGSANMVIDLYTVAGSRVGTIAVSNDTAGSYLWHIPRYPQNYMCTMQYPNGLCGTDIPVGQYFIKVTAASDGFNPTNGNTYSSATSGVFAVNQQ